MQSRALPERQNGKKLATRFRAANDSIEVLKVFTKFQTGRGMPVWLQALRQAAEPSVCREVDFYSIVQPQLEQCIVTPTPLLTAKLPWLNYVLLVLEFIDLETVVTIRSMEGIAKSSSASAAGSGMCGVVIRTIGPSRS